MSFRDSMKLTAGILSKMPGYERFSEKLMKIYENFVEIALKMVKPDPQNDIKVLNHGDLWVNNFLFKYNEQTNQPIDIVFVSFKKVLILPFHLFLNFPKPGGLPRDLLQ